MSVRFRVDLLNPGVDLRHGAWAGPGLGESLGGSAGPRRLMLFALGCLGVLAVVLVAGILPPYWRLRSELNAVPRLRQDLAGRESELTLLRSNLSALSDEARRQVRWGEVLTTLSQQIPATLKLQVVDSASGPPEPAPTPQAGAAPRIVNTVRIDALTPVRAGSPPLLDVAQFMVGLMRDPAVNKRFQLRSWEIKPGAPGPEGSVPMLGISIVLAERPQ